MIGPSSERPDMPENFARDFWPNRPCALCSDQFLGEDGHHMNFVTFPWRVEHLTRDSMSQRREYLRLTIDEDFVRQVQRMGMWGFLCEDCSMAFEPGFEQGELAFVSMDQALRFSQPEQFRQPNTNDQNLISAYIRRNFRDDRKHDIESYIGSGFATYRHAASTVFSDAASTESYDPERGPMQGFRF